MGSHENSTPPFSDMPSLIKLVQEATRLSVDQAKTIIYYALATYGLPELKKFPLLVLYGVAGTGKSTIEGIVQQLAYNPVPESGESLINASELSAAALRNLLTPETTVLLDEGDRIEERLLVSRYARAVTATNQPKLSKKGQQIVGWELQKQDLFGATVIHRRKQFKDHALYSRSIIIRTKRHSDGAKPFRSELFAPYKQRLVTLSAGMSWDVSSWEGERIKDTWAPLYEAAAFLDDNAWLDYADSEIRASTATFDIGQENEPRQIAFLSLLALAVHDDRSMREECEEPKDRVLLADITKRLKAEGQDMNSWQVSQTLQELGFERQLKGGDAYIYTDGKDRLADVARSLDIEDDYFKDEK